MKYRIKDPETREKLIALGCPTEFDDNAYQSVGQFEWQGKKTFFLYHLRYELEPIKELAEGWHPYPDEKPEKANEPYLIALKNDDDVDYFDTRWFDGKVFDLWDSNIIAWRECPKLWKE